MKPQGHIPASASPSAHEPADLDISRVLRSAGVLALIIAGSILVLLLFFRLVQHEFPARTSEAAPRVETSQLPPEPRLQTDPTHDLQVLRAAEDLHLNHYGWIDRPHGVAQIPVERAMELYVKSPQVAAPPAVTNAPPLTNSPPMDGVTELQMRQDKAQEGAHAP